MPRVYFLYSYVFFISLKIFYLIEFIFLFFKNYDFASLYVLINMELE